LYECQKKGVTEFVFRKLLILKDAILVVLGLARAEVGGLKRKAGASSRTPNGVIHKIKCITRAREKSRIMLQENWAGDEG
jgi:hypothetical protein